MKDIPDYEHLYVQGYDMHNVDKTLAGKLLQKSHRLLEASLPSNFEGQEILEVGAGSGHHFSYLNRGVKKYVMTDGSDFMLQVALKRYKNEVALGKLIIEKQDANKLSYNDGIFDRLIATHVLEHIPNPVFALREWNRVVRKGGIISLVLPCDPGLLWRLGRSLGPRRNATRLGLPYDYLQAAEHVNSIFNLIVFIRYHFDEISEFWYPSRLSIPDVNLFYICHIKT
jgi:phosphatidylethanolamine/phosphatidyl-N-methylethanolamine N-methyltransferase